MFLDDDARIGEMALTPSAAIVTLLLHLTASSFGLSWCLLASHYST